MVHKANRDRQFPAFEPMDLSAIKAGDEGKIDTLTQDMARLDAQQMAIQAKAQSRVYSSLTADQKAKVDQRPGALNGLMRRGGPGDLRREGRQGPPPQN